MTARHSILLVALGLGACADEASAPQFRIDPVCIDDDSTPQGAWVCSESLVIDCNDASVPDQIYVEVDSCGGTDLQSVDTPEGPGEYEVVIVDGNTGDPVCQSDLTIVDPLPPVITTQDVSLWPPNHKMHTIALDDCIVDIDDCDPDLTMAITYVSSDEPDDDNGDGHTSGDIAIVAPTVASVRSERQGGSNGRVYTIAFTVTDGSGNVTESSCLATVNHDHGKKGAAVDDGEAYRVEAP